MTLRICHNLYYNYILMCPEKKNGMGQLLNNLAFQEAKLDLDGIKIAS